MSQYQYTVVFETDQDEGGYVATAPILGIASEGETVDEALAMIREAIEGYLEGLQQEGQPNPIESETAGTKIRTEQVAVRV